MKERLPTVLLALGALLLFYLLFVPKPQRAATPEGLPLSIDGRADGYLATWRWLGAQHIRRLSLRYRYDRLPALVHRPRGNLLLLTLPQRVPMQADELAALRRWINQGNTVLIVAALDDTPLWSLGTDGALALTDLRRLTGLQFTSTSAPLLHALRGRQPQFVGVEAQPLLAGVSRLQPVAALPASNWSARPLPGAPVALTLATRRHLSTPTLWLQSRGAGQIILCAAASPISNAGLLLADNARFLANVVSWSVGPGGTVVFDDAHEGLTAFYDAAAFFADPRLHGTLGWLVVLWLAFVLGTQRMRAVRSPWQPVDESAYIEASARYLAAVVRPEDLGQRLIEEFIAEIHRRAPRTDPWDWLHSMSGVPARDYRALERFHARARSGARIDLIRLQTLLARLRRDHLT